MKEGKFEQKIRRKSEVNLELEKLMRSDAKLSVEETYKILREILGFQEGFNLPIDSLLAKTDEERRLALIEIKNKEAILKKNLLEEAFDSESDLQRALDVVELEAAK